ncbi:MAG: hypothetical protein BWK78_08525 [Thiotrichaceae bacterium IS1]|nr:MAG: hypothetical protein BWK78_08525 [Thiotrichaceae bacterium IS1]
MNREGALKLLEISAQLASGVMQARAQLEDLQTLPTDEVKRIFSECVDIVYEKYEVLPLTREEASEIDQKFETIGELHRIFAEKFAEYDRRLGMARTRSSRRPV